MSNKIPAPSIKANNISAAFAISAQRLPDKIALIGMGGEGRNITFGEMLAEISEMTTILNGEAFHNQPEIAILSENCPDWPIAYMAILKACKTVVPIDANLKENEIAYIIEHAQIKTVICSTQFEKMFSDSNAKIDVISFDQNSEQYWRNKKSNQSSKPDSSLDDIAVLIYTSGTTGAPKAVQLTHRNLLANVEGAREALDIDGHEKFLSVLPLHHTFEALAGFLLPMLTGGSIVYARSLKSRDIIQDIGNNDISVMCGVPLLYEKMYQSMNRAIDGAPLARKLLFNILFRISAIGWSLGFHWGKTLFASLRSKAGLNSIYLFVSGGAPLPPSIARFFCLIGFLLIEGYGLTETSPILSANRSDDIKFGSVGAPLPNVEIKINQPNEQGIGEIIARGDSITPGYRDNPEQTAELIRDGWLHTGDLGRLKDGHLWITGRAKNLIVSAAGKNIFPEELEVKLLLSKYLIEVIVFGRKKDGRQGEEVCALLVPDSEQFVSEFGKTTEEYEHNELMNILLEEVNKTNAELASYKRITSVDYQIDELEKTSTKKVKRYVYK